MITEDSGDDIRGKVIKALSFFKECDEEHTEAELDKVYRTNTKFAKLRNVLREVLFCQEEDKGVGSAAALQCKM